MWFFWREDKDTLCVGFTANNETHMNFSYEYTPDNIVKSMMLVNYLNGGDGKPFPLDGGVNDARNENQN